VFEKDFSEKFKMKYSTDFSDLIRNANAIRDGKIKVLGSNEILVSEFKNRVDLKWLPDGLHSEFRSGTVTGKIPWHFDVKSGMGWDPSVYFADLKFGHVKGVDIKVPWELSRSAPLVTLGQAYALTRDEAYAKSFFEIVEDWIRFNPPEFGVNWACSMDVGLRACNWLLAWEFFSNSKSITPFFKDNFAASLMDHGKHLYAHLEWAGEVSSNHYLSNLIGLLYLGLALHQDTWFGFAKKELEKEILAQTFIDGFDYEGSTAYHRLVLEIFFYSAVVLTRSHRPAWSDNFLARLKQMFHITLQVANQSGRVPLMGDNDSGRVFILCERDDADFSYLSAFGAHIFNDPSLKITEWRNTSEATWIFGLPEESKSMAGISHKKIKSKASGDSGILTLKGENDHLVFSAQNNGIRGVGSHTHNDKLSFTLSVFEDEYLVDPGTYVYTPDPSLRQLFRSTRMHNTVEIDGEEQNRIDLSNLFMLEDDAYVEVLESIEGKKIRARHTGYHRLAEPVTHERTIERMENCKWLLKDEFMGQGKHKLNWTFIVGPGIPCDVSSGTDLMLIGKSGTLRISCKSMNLKPDIKNGYFSGRYGELAEVENGIFYWQGNLPVSMTFEIDWIKKEEN
jgi:hypothetical protein